VLADNGCIYCILLVMGPIRFSKLIPSMAPWHSLMWFWHYPVVDFGKLAVTILWVGFSDFGNDGCIYWPPCRSNRALKFDPETKLRSLVGDDFGGETSITKWKSGLAGPNGAIYCIPNGATRLLVIDPLKEFVIGLQTNLEQYPEELGCLFKIDDKHCKTTFEPSESLASRKSLK
jgi:hypothetical protein